MGLLGLILQQSMPYWGNGVWQQSLAKVLLHTPRYLLLSGT